MPPTRQHVTSDFAAGAVDSIYDLARRAGVAPLTVSSHLADNHALLDPKMPVVFVAERPDLIADRPLVSSVAVDDAAGAIAVAQHLLSLGHRRIGYVAIGRPSLAGEARQAGYEAALQEAGVGPDPTLVAVPRRSDPADASAEGVGQLLARRPTAIVFYNDLAAIGGLPAILDRGIRVPEQVSIAGVDDLEIARLVSPPLTTIAQPRVEMGRMAVERLLAMIGGDGDRTAISATCTLVVRRSTAPPPQ